MKEVIVIRAHACLSPLGSNRQSITDCYRSGKPGFQTFKGTPVGALTPDSETLLTNLAHQNRNFRGLDRSVLMAIYASREAVAQAGWAGQRNISINIGSSRGATTLIEHYLNDFRQSGHVAPQTSPVTTLGNISSWVAQDLQAQGALISHSVTCSTGVQAIANGVAWLRAGMAQKFLAGASEAPLTPFTIAQMKALGIYSDDVSSAYPCRPLNDLQKNTFVLGEGAAVFALEKVSSDSLYKVGKSPVLIESVGFGLECISSKTSVSSTGEHFKLAIQKAIDNSDETSPIDLVVMHAPGTVAGDAAELNALKSLFKNNMPLLSSVKWLTGHSLGASGCLSLDYAIDVLETQSYLRFPYPTLIETAGIKPIWRVLVVAAGFGGNAAAVIIKKAW